MATTTVTTHQLNQVLEDYKIHLSGDDKTAVSQSEAASATVTVNPPNWPTDRNRVPPFRAINRHLDLEQRTLGSNAFETGFLIVMFSGVSLNAVSDPERCWLNRADCFERRLQRFGGKREARSFRDCSDMQSEASGRAVEEFRIIHVKGNIWR